MRGPAATPTTCICLARRMRPSCARRTRMRAIRGIDTAAARAVPGVLAVLTGEDYRGGGPYRHRQLPVPADVIDHQAKAFGRIRPARRSTRRSGRSRSTRVRHVGEPVAVVVAETADAARDAAAAVEVDYEILPAVTDALDALAPGAPALHEAAPGQHRARYRVRRRAPRSTPRSPPPTSSSSRRSATSASSMRRWSRAPRSGTTMRRTTATRSISGNQGVHRQRLALARVPRACAPERVRVICPDVGGAFGLRTNVYPEQVVVVWAARQRRPAGEMDRRPLRMLPHRLAGPRPRDQSAARARPLGPHPGARGRSCSAMSARTRSPMCR